MLRKIWQVKKILQRASRETSRFQMASGLYCLSDCSECCLKHDIEATVLEFLPLAYHLYTKGEAEYWMNEIEGKSNNGNCVFYTQGGFSQKSIGGCRFYSHRALICRLFGFSAQLDRMGGLRLVTCRRMNRENQVEIGHVRELVHHQSIPVPVYEHYMLSLHSIDVTLANKYYPINEAIFRALDYISLHFHYVRLGA